MACLNGVAVAGAGAAAKVGGNCDGPGFLSSLFFGVRSNIVAQDFSRCFAAIDYKIQRQQLNREDFRDLIELTANRMDIYHIVGTLLLTFCIGWYTDSTIVAADVFYNRAWFTDIFLISNFSAVGYLVLCVWLAMYAAVASRSIGTRLLTSYARLALPTKRDLDAIKIPMFFNPSDIFKKKFRRSSSDPDLGRQSQWHALAKEVDSEDHQLHFRRFLEELPRWLVYDTWARACMSFGMSQLLRALSYFSVGMIWNTSPSVAVMSMIALRILSTIVMWLDYGALHLTGFDVFMIMLLNILPPLLAIGVILMDTMGEIDEADGYFASSMVALCFWAHAGWLWYIVEYMQTAPRPGAGNLQGPFKAGNYAHVLEWVQPVAGDDYESRNEDSDWFGGGPAQYGACRNEVNGGRTPGRWGRHVGRRVQPFQLDLETATSTDWLPVRTTRCLTYAIMAYYFLAGCVHAGVILSKNYEYYGYSTMVEDTARSSDFLQRSGSTELLGIGSKRTLKVQWPEPAPLFHVAAFHCSGSKVWLSSGFSLYAMEKRASDATDNLELVSDSNVGTVFCGGRACHALVQGRREQPWVLERLPPRAHTEGGYRLWDFMMRLIRISQPLRRFAPQQVPIPSSWRIVSGAWMACLDCASPIGGSVTLAGWDGSKVYLATLRKADFSERWELHKRFAFDPSSRTCPSGHAGCSTEEPGKYDSVRALQLSEDGRGLLILLGAGVIDVWDLATGLMRDRLRLGENYTAMCVSGARLLLSRRGIVGPEVVATTVPSSWSGLLPHGDGSRPAPTQQQVSGNRLTARNEVDGRARADNRTVSAHRISLTVPNIRQQVSANRVAVRDAVAS